MRGKQSRGVVAGPRLVAGRWSVVAGFCYEWNPTYLFVMWTLNLFSYNYYYYYCFYLYFLMFLFCFALLCFFCVSFMMCLFAYELETMAGLALALDCSHVRASGKAPFLWGNKNLILFFFILILIWSLVVFGFAFAFAFPLDLQWL